MAHVVPFDTSTCIIGRLTFASFHVADAGLLACVDTMPAYELIYSLFLRTKAAANAVRETILVRRGGMPIATRGMRYGTDRRNRILTNRRAPHNYYVPGVH